MAYARACRAFRDKQLLPCDQAAAVIEEGEAMAWRPRHLGFALVVAVMSLTLAACTRMTSLTDAASATTTPAPATQPPDGSGAIVVVPSGNYTGECVVVAHSDNLGDEPRQTIHWRFTVLNDDRVKLFSANSGYAIVLARTADATFLGSGVLPGQNGWRQMLKLVVTASDDKGTATKLDAVVMDRLSGAPQPTWVRAICKMAARAE